MHVSGTQHSRCHSRVVSHARGGRRWRRCVASAQPGSTDKEFRDAGGRQTLFNDIAPIYDTLNDALSLGLHRVWKTSAVQWVSPPVGGRALDVCCGSGDLALRLAHAVGPAGSVTAVDFADAQLARAAAREEALLASNASEQQQRCRVTWMHGDAQSLPFEGDSFDGATCGYGLRNVLDARACLAELHRVLRPGARLAVLDFNKSGDGVTSAVQSAFLDWLVVPVASAAGAADEYRYLKGSIAAYFTGQELEDMARGAGFARATFYELSGGLMGCLVAQK